MLELTAEQKIRQTLTGDPDGSPTFQHEGDQVIRWLTGGNAPDAWVTFHPTPGGDQTVVTCAGCGEVIGYLPADPYQLSERAERIAAMRQAGHELHKPEGWPHQ